jgi:hypothetical protein
MDSSTLPGDCGPDAAADVQFTTVLDQQVTVAEHIILTGNNKSLCFYILFQASSYTPSKTHSFIQRHPVWHMWHQLLLEKFHVCSAFQMSDGIGIQLNLY